MSKIDLLEAADLAVSQAFQLTQIIYGMLSEHPPQKERAGCDSVVSEACWLLLGLISDKLAEAKENLGKLVEGVFRDDK
jgi:hypothetical protein